jgi:hypothetical protein
MNSNSPRPGTRFGLLVVGMFVLLSSALLVAQTTLSTGSVAGTVTDPSGAVVGGAKVVVTNTGTNQTFALTSNSAGAFSSGPLDPGNYNVQVSSKGFSPRPGEYGCRSAGQYSAGQH